jgi:hypothetical protein
MNGDPGTAAVQPGDGGLAELRMQSDQAVQAADAAQQLDPEHPPVRDPRDSGLFQPATPATRLQRLVADCTVCGGRTVQDMFEFVVGRWAGVRTGSHYRETAAGKTGRHVHFRSCAVCGCMYPADADSTRIRSATGDRSGRGAPVDECPRAEQNRQFCTSHRALNLLPVVASNWRYGDGKCDVAAGRLPS